MKKPAVTLRSPVIRRGFTLAELAIAMAASSMLVAGMTSAIFLAVRSADTNSATTLAIQGSLGLEDITAELRDAIYFKQRTATSVMFTVPDRDGDSDVETIRYSWSGTAGDPLHREYNGGTAVAVLDDVHVFSLVYSIQTNASANNLLLVVPNEDSLDADDTAKRTAMAGWGYNVTPVTAARPDAELDALAAMVDVIYISENILSSNLNTKLNDATAGIVNEEAALHDDLKLSSSGGGGYTSTYIRIADNAHYITSPFSIGSLQIATSSQQLVRTNGTLAPDLDVLGKDVGGTIATLAIVGPGGQLQNGTTAAGPRLTSPVGNDFTFSALNSTGLTLLQRVIDWAAGIHRVTSVGITLQIGADSGSAMQTGTEIRSRPRA